METVMGARFVVIAVAMLAAGTAAAAEPPKAPSKPVAQPSDRPAPVLLASADQVSAPSPAQNQSAPAPVRKRAARVTACRCGDQIAEQPEQ
jgi:hypothetical protein